MNQTQETKNQVLEQKTNKIIAFEKTISDSVQNRITELSQGGRLDLPANYSVGNALNSAWLIIQGIKDKNGNTALQVCTKESIANALLDMSIMGLNPAKKQGYFIVYGNQLTWFTSYFGKCAVVKRLKGIENEPIATLIYKGDEIELGHNELGEECVLSHKASWEGKLSGEIVGVYATVMQGKIKRSAVMTFAEVKEAWTKNPSPANRRDHVDFAGEFTKRTAINRLTKMIIQTSNDDDLLGETFVTNEDKHYDFDNAIDVENKVVQEIETNANTCEVLDVELEEEQEPEQEKPVEKQEQVIIQADRIVVEQKQQPKQQSLFAEEKVQTKARPF